MTASTSGRAGKHKLASAVELHPAIEYGFVALYWLSFFWIFYVFYNRDPSEAAEFGLVLGLTVVTNLSCQALFRRFGVWVSKTFLSNPPFNHPLSKHIPQRKFGRQMWGCLHHTLCTIWQLHIFTKITWWDNPQEAFIPHPKYQTFPESIRLFYVIELAVYVFAGFATLYLEDRKKDHIAMMSHHLITALLIGGSYFNNYLRIGFLVLFVHYISDILVDGVKIFNLLKLDGRKGFYLTEITYFLMLSFWIYYRLYLYPVKVIKAALFDYHCLHADHDKCEIWKNPFPKDMPFWGAACVLLCMLLWLHIWWFALLVRIAYGMMIHGAHNTGRSQYEGASDSEDDAAKRK